jgi:hypothetical protein
MRAILAFLLLSSSALTGCVSVSSAMPGLTSSTGEAWYSKDTIFLGLPLGSDIFYCSQETPGRCVRASFQEGMAPAPATSTATAPATAVPDPSACDQAREYAQRAAGASDDTARAALQRIADRKAAACRALQQSAPASAKAP